MMTWKEMLKIHEDELATFKKNIRAEYEKIYTKQDLSKSEKDNFVKEWDHKYSHLVSKHHQEAEQILSQEKDSKKVETVISVGKLNSDWIEEQARKKAENERQIAEIKMQRELNRQKELGKQL